MDLFRNREVRNQIVISFGVIFALTALAAVFSGVWGALFVLCCGAAVIAVHIHYLKKRYKAISGLSADLDRILHGQEELFISGTAEGELAVLSTEIEKMTLMLKEQKDQLISDKVQLTDAIADMFHQMRTPVTSMALQLSLMGSEELSSERRMELTRELKKQLERLHWLTETLLKMSRLDAGTVEFREDEVLVKTLAGKACEPFLIPLELKNVDLSIKASDEKFTGDLTWTVEAVGNLVKNCMEHTPAGGRIEIEAQETALYTQITVQDNGEGFSEADLPHIFERFYRGSNSAEGSIGIGLALSRAIIARQKGTITAENAPRGGARFVVKFYKSVI